MKSLFTLLALLTAATGLRGALSRPAPAIGPDAKTLVVHADARAPYSLTEGLEILRLQIQRVATHVQTVALSNATPAHLDQADYLVVFCPQSRPHLPTNFLQALANFTRPMLWIGFGAGELEELPGFRGEFVFSRLFLEKTASNVVYRGKTWKGPIHPWIPVQPGSNSTAQILMTVQEQGLERPLAWRCQNAIFIATVPLWDPVNYLFSDLLLDFFQVTDVPQSHLLLRVDDYHAGSDHRQLQRWADYLHSRGLPYALALTPSSRNPETSMVETLDVHPDFVTALRYAQQRGARLVMNGCIFDEHRFEFWDARFDKPRAAQTPESYRARLHDGVRTMLRHGLLPLAWQTPASAASRDAYGAVANVFSTAVERVQLSDATSREVYAPSSLTVDAYGRLIIPENGGYALLTPINPLDGVRERLEVITSLRGVIASACIHSYQRFDRLTAFVDLLQSYNLPFLDLADLDHWVQTPEALILTGEAVRSVELQEARVQSRTFDRTGRQLTHEREASPYTGKRTFKAGGGHHTVIEFGKSRP